MLQVPAGIASGPSEQEYRPVAAPQVGQRAGQLKWGEFLEDVAQLAHRALTPARSVSEAWAAGEWALLEQRTPVVVRSGWQTHRG